MSDSLKTFSRAQLSFALPPNISPFIFDLYAFMSHTVLSGAASTVVTDHSGGTPAGATSPIPLPSTEFLGAVVGTENVAPKAGWDAALILFSNANAVLAAYINQYLSKIHGSPTLSVTDGTVATAGTVPALSGALTGVDGAGNDALEFFSARSSSQAVVNGLATLIKGYNIAASAANGNTLPDFTGGYADPHLAIPVTSTATAAGVDGVTIATVTLNEANTFLASAANIYATLSAFLNTLKTTLAAPYVPSVLLLP